MYPYLIDMITKTNEYKYLHYLLLLLLLFGSGGKYERGVRRHRANIVRILTGMPH